MIEQLVASALENWEHLSPHSMKPRDIRYVVQSRRRVVVFLFDARKAGDKLAAVIKFPRRAQDNAALQRCVRAMSEVRAQLQGSVRETVPRAILLPPINGLCVSMEQGMPGTPMSVGSLPVLAPVRNDRNWTAWRQWLCQFQRQTVICRQSITQATIEERIMPGIVRALGHRPTSPRVVADLHALVRELDGHPISKVWLYGDAHHSNILVKSKRVAGVVDWEGAQPGHWPTSDWLQFAVQYLVDVSHVQRPTATRTALGEKAIDSLLKSPSNRLERLVQTQTHDFLSTWDIDPGALPAFLIAFLAQFHWPWDKGALLRQAHAAVCT